MLYTQHTVDSVAVFMLGVVLMLFNRRSSIQELHLAVAVYTSLWAHVTLMVATFMVQKRVLPSR